MIKTYFKLYINELKRSKILFVLLFIANFILLPFYREIVHSRIISISITRFPLYTLLFALPLFLYCSFTIEQRTNTNYLLFPLPVKRSAIIFSKYLVFFSMALIFTIGHFIYLVIHIILHNDFQEALEFIFLYRPLYILSPIFSYAGILCAAEAVQYITKRYKTVLVFIFLTASHLSTLWLAKFIRALFGDLTLGGNYGSSLREYLKPLIKFETQNVILFNGYLIVMGLVFLMGAIFLYNKYSDV